MQNEAVFKNHVVNVISSAATIIRNIWLRLGSVNYFNVCNRDREWLESINVCS